MYSDDESENVTTTISHDFFLPPFVLYVYFVVVG